MLSWKSSRILAVLSIGGGLALTVVSGLYVVKPLVIDAEEVHFGFPLAWCEGAQGGPLKTTPWTFWFIYQNFIADFLLYGSFIAIATWIYFTYKISGRNSLEISMKAAESI